MDCNITLNYAQELGRMCLAHHACVGCPLRPDKDCLNAIYINPKRMEVVQKWSDSNPESLKK